MIHYSPLRLFVIFLALLSAGRAKADVATDKPMDQYLAAVLTNCDQVEKRIPELTKLGEFVAERQIKGGILGVIWEPVSPTGPQGTQYELRGRSGGLVAFDAALAKALPTASREKDTAIIGWQRAPGPEDLEILKRYHEKFFIIAFGPRNLPELAEHVKLADAWIDTGAGAGRNNALLNVLNSWALMGEVVAALTRGGKMPAMLKSHAWEDSKEWNGRYRQKMVLHDDLTVPPIPAGTLSRRYLDQIRALTRKFGATQAPAVTKAAELIAAELAQGRKTLVAQSGHTVYEHTGQYEDRAWATPLVLEGSPGRLRGWTAETPDGALVLRVGYLGEERKILDVLNQKRQRVLLITSPRDPRPGFQVPPGLAAVIDMGWDFGDACVEVEGYPIRIFPPSGAMQLIAYEAINAEVLSRLAPPAPAPAPAAAHWPPAIPDAVNGTASVATDEFLSVPEAVAKLRGAAGAAPFTVAKTPPLVELAFHGGPPDGGLPDRALNGTGWTSWGDIVVARDGRVYSGIGNHGRNGKLPAEGGGQAFIYCWNPAAKTLSRIADLNALSGAKEGDTTWSKVHAGIQEDADGGILFTGTLNDGGRSFQTAWTPRVPGGQLFRYDPRDGTTKLLTAFSGEVTPTTLMDRERGVWYANMEGKSAARDVALTAVDVKTGQIIFQSPHDAVMASRNLALTRDGMVLFNGKGGLWKYDPATKTTAPTGSSFPGTLTMRSSTRESQSGAVYGTTSRPGVLFRYTTATGKLDLLGPDFLTGDYTTVTVLSPDEKYIYYLPGAHGGAANIGTPVVQYEIKTGRRKVLAFLRSGMEKAINYTPAGSYGVKISADGSTLYAGFNGNLAHDPSPPARQAKGFGLTAFAAIHIPASERP